jgi:hypothetical protein
VSGGDHRWFKGSTGKERHVTRDINNNNNNNNTLTILRIVLNLMLLISKKLGVGCIPGPHCVKNKFLMKRSFEK